MTRPLLPALAACLWLATPAPALDLNTMSDAEREAFRAEIRAYLLDNPEVIMEAVAVLEQRDQAAQLEADKELAKANADDLHNAPGSWEGGNPDGDITLVEFIDYRCGYCRRAFDEVEELVESDGNIRFIVKEFPILGEESLLSSRFAIATLQLAGEEAYKDVHDSLITFNGQVNETTLARIGDELALDSAAILAHMDSDEVTRVITENRALAGRLNISGTPSFVMNDRMLRGYLPLDGMQQQVADIRAE